MRPTAGSAKALSGGICHVGSSRVRCPTRSCVRSHPARSRASDTNDHALTCGYAMGCHYAIRIRRSGSWCVGFRPVAVCCLLGHISRFPPDHVLVSNAGPAAGRGLPAGSAAVRPGSPGTASPTPSPGLPYHLPCTGSTGIACSLVTYQNSGQVRALLYVGCQPVRSFRILGRPDRYSPHCSVLRRLSTRPVPLGHGSQPFPADRRTTRRQQSPARPTPSLACPGCAACSGPATA
jgi:hypothetical protein